LAQGRNSNRQLGTATGPARKVKLVGAAI